MKKLTLPALLATSVCVAGCVSMLSNETPPINTAYTTENPQGAGVVQVFEIGANTVVQVRNIETVAPVIIDERGYQMKYQIYGQNAVLEGRPSVFRVVTLNGTSTIKRAASITARTEAVPTADATLKSAASPASATPAAPVIPATTAGVAPDIEAKYKDESPEALQAEIERMKKELAEIKGLLGQTPSGRGSRSNPVPAKPTRESFSQSTVIVQFADNSDKFEPGMAERSALRELARSAALLKVAGYTDSFTPNNHAKALATLRAMAAKEYLVGEGVHPTKIMVKAVPAGGFIADNRTKEGKAANRRVEITAS